MRTQILRRALFLMLLTCSWGASNAAPAPRTAASDRQALVALEDEWLAAHDAATLDRILAADFVHPVPAGVFLTKAEHIDWVTKHAPPPDRRLRFERFERLDVWLYGDVANRDGGGGGEGCAR